MKDQIISNIGNPIQLEKLYRTDKSAFKQAFRTLSPEITDTYLVSFWNARLNFSKDEASPGPGKDLLFVIIASLLAGIVAKFPAIFSINEELFFSRNIGFIVFPALTAYFAWKHKLPAGRIALIAGTFLLCLIFINVLPNAPQSDTLVLSCIHMLLLLWSALGLAFVGKAANTDDSRLGFLRYNGDLIVITTLILIAGAILTGITIGLFSLIGFDIHEFYFNYIAIFGLPAAPILGTSLIRTNPQLVGKISPVIARIFSPLVLVMLSVYLIAMVYSGKDPYNDREFLMIFNVLLIGVMAIIFFSVAEASKTERKLTEIWIVFLLCLVTLVVNSIALSAILFRISEWGITPNRLAVLAGNLLILGNLFWVSLKLYRSVTQKADITGVGYAIARYLPVYCLWAAFVTFIFPLIFGFK